MKLQLKQSNFGSFSTGHAQLRWDVDFDEAREIIGAHCVTRDDKVKEWFVKVPDLQNIGDSSLIAFLPLTLVSEGEQELQEYMQEPTHQVRCLPDWTDPEYLKLKASSWEARHGGPGSTVDLWVMSSFITRLTLGVKMYPTAAFTPMPNASGVITGEEPSRGFNDGTTRGYPCCSHCPQDRSQMLWSLTQKS